MGSGLLNHESLLDEPRETRDLRVLLTKVSRLSSKTFFRKIAREQPTGSLAQW